MQTVGAIMAFVGFYCVSLPSSFALAFKAHLGLKGLWTGAFSSPPFHFWSSTWLVNKLLCRHVHRVHICGASVRGCHSQDKLAAVFGDCGGKSVGRC
jgi:hypothetical protein